MSSKKFWKHLFKKSAKDRNKDNKSETKIIERKTSCSDDKIFYSSTQSKINESNDRLNEYSKTKRTTDKKEMSKWDKFSKRMNGFRKLCLKLLCCCRQKRIHKSISHSSINEEMSERIETVCIVISSRYYVFHRYLIIATVFICMCDAISAISGVWSFLFLNRKLPKYFCVSTLIHKSWK